VLSPENSVVTKSIFVGQGKISEKWQPKALKKRDEGVNGLIEPEIPCIPIFSVMIP
jgi:hypothetical protein